MRLLPWRSALLLLVVLSVWHTASAGVLVVDPVDDAQAGYSYPGPSLGILIDGSSDILISSDPLDNEYSLAMFEFDISPLAPGQTVLSASLQFDVNLWTGSSEPLAQAAVYDGVDGQVTPGDFAALLEISTAGTQEVSLGLVTIDLDLAPVQAIVNTNANYLGMALTVLNHIHQNYRITALETQSQFFQPAQLTIEYVPEPSSWLLLGAALPALVLAADRGKKWRRKR